MIDNKLFLAIYILIRRPQFLLSCIFGLWVSFFLGPPHFCVVGIIFIPRIFGSWVSFLLPAFLGRGDHFYSPHFWVVGIIFIPRIFGSSVSFLLPRIFGSWGSFLYVSLSEWKSRKTWKSIILFSPEKPVKVW